jgi:molecular chaperone GrpE
MGTGTDERASDDWQQALAAKTEEVQAVQDKLLRLAAEFENYKRIVQRDVRDQTKFANENLLKDLLPTVDNLERAIGFAKSAPGCDTLVEGVSLTLKQLLETLGRFGVRQIASVGEVFDPAHHQAVARVPSANKPENTVVEEYQKGYLLHDRVVRPAMVGVAVADTTSPDGSGA